MRRSELARATPLRRTTPLRNRHQIAPKPRTPDPVPADTRQALRQRSGNKCEASIAGVCSGWATDLHHRQRRGLKQHSIWNCLHLCREDHRWIHAHPAEARRCGWIVSSYTQPDIVPVLIRGKRVLLDAAGGYLESAS